MYYFGTIYADTGLPSRAKAVYLYLQGPSVFLRAPSHIT